MSWLGRVLRRRPSLSPDHAAALEAYLAQAGHDPASAIGTTRLVVVDVETSGFDPERDSLIGIGAIGAANGLIRFAERLEAVMRQDEPSAPENILVHGIDGTAQVSGLDPAEALVRFISFAGKSPLVAFHAGFDRAFISRALRAHLGIALANDWLDLAELAPALFPEHAARAQTLDEWITLFDIVNYARHDALADALATAQLLQIVLARAERQGLRRYSELGSYAKAQRWLERR